MTQNLKYRNILLSIAALGAIGALVAGVTTAFYGDVEKSTGNTFTAGAIDLLVDSEAHYNGMVCVEDETGTTTWQFPGDPEDAPEFPPEGSPCVGTWAETDLEDGVHTFFEFLDLKPGDHGENTISLHVYNNDAWGQFEVANVIDRDNTCTSPEQKAEGGACSDPDGDGEIDNYLRFSGWLDQGRIPGFQCGDADLGDGRGARCEEDPVEGDNIFQEEFEGPLFWDNVLIGDLGPFDLAPVFQAAYGLYSCDSLGAVDGDTEYDVCHGLAEDGRMVESVTYYFGLAWELPLDETGNDAQTDEYTADMIFRVEQHRHNDDPFAGGPVVVLPAVGAALSDFAVATSSCDVIVTGTSSIQTAIESALDGDVICVDPSYDATGDTYPLTVDVPNLTLTGLGAAGDADIPGGIFIDESGVTITGLEFTGYSEIQSSADAAIYIHNEVGQGSGVPLTGTAIEYNIFTAPGSAKADHAKGIITEIGSASAVASGISVMHNTFSDWRQGIFFNPANYEVAFNDFTGNDVGIANDGPHASAIHHNDFDGNVLEAVGVAPDAIGATSNDGALTVNMNNFTPAGLGNNVNWYGTSVFGGADVDATDNWWDSEVESDRTNDTSEVDTSSPAGSAFPHN